MHRRAMTLLAAALVLPLALLAPGPAAAQSGLDFTLVNRTGYPIDQLYVGPTTSRSWGNDILGQDTLPDTQSVNVRFNRNASACQWDLKVVYSDGDESEFRNVNLCSVARITLFWNRQAGTTRFVTE